MSNIDPIQYKPGDQVGLKSGSPTMTVIRIIEDKTEGHQVYCVWFAGTEPKAGTYPPAALEKR
jgi:uncharacterized protein YodC (DUF2158 family)